MRFFRMVIFALLCLTTCSISSYGQSETAKKMVGTWTSSITEPAQDGIETELTILVQYASNGKQMMMVTLKYIINGQTSDDMVIMHLRGTWSVRETYRKKTLEEDLGNCQVTKNLIKEYLPDPCGLIEFMGDDGGSTEILAVTDKKMILKVTEGEEEDIYTFTKM